MSAPILIYITPLSAISMVLMALLLVGTVWNIVSSYKTRRKHKQILEELAANPSPIVYGDDGQIYVRKNGGAK